MKFHLILVLLSLASATIASVGAGPYHTVFWWYAYRLGVDSYGVSNNPIATGCPGPAADGSCYFDEFVKYIDKAGLTGSTGIKTNLDPTVNDAVAGLTSAGYKNTLNAPLLLPQDFKAAPGTSASLQKILQAIAPYISHARQTAKDADTLSARLTKMQDCMLQATQARKIEQASNIVEALEAYRTTWQADTGMTLDLVYSTKVSADGTTYTALDADATIKANPTVKKGVVKYIRSFVTDYNSEYYNPEADAEIPHPYYPAAYQHVRFRPGIDILHFNWDEGDEGAYDFWNDEDNAIPYFCAVARKAVHNPISITDRHLRQNFDDPFFAGSVRVAALDKYAIRDHWLVLIQTISFDFTDDAEALQSGLFGEFELDPVRYVNPNDSETLHRYCQLWRTQNPTDITACTTTAPAAPIAPWTREVQQAAAVEFFALLEDGHKPLHDRLARWKEYVDRRWVWNVFHRITEEAKAGAPVSVPDRDVLFLPPYPGYDWEDDEETYEYFRSKYTLNRGHPWIQAVLDKMPVFQPMILFRHRMGIGCNGR
ncbi:hypothetical protein CBS147346_10891 [Aspergillus niger]|nr:hypothetical protein CBS147346_10891 [Aspergillus niger]